MVSIFQDVYHDSFSEESILCTPVQHFASLPDVLESFKKGVANFAALPVSPIIPQYIILIHRLKFITYV